MPSTYVFSRRAWILSGLKPTHQYGRPFSCDADAAAGVVDLVAVPAAPSSPPHAPPPAALLLLQLEVAVTVLLVAMLMLIAGGPEEKKLVMAWLPGAAAWLLLCLLRCLLRW